jgi:hypothetical protein
MKSGIIKEKINDISNLGYIMTKKIEIRKNIISKFAKKHFLCFIFVFGN